MTRTALVTGGAAGIGLGISLRLAKEGMNVGVLDINPAAIETALATIKGAGGKAIGLQADVSKRDQVNAAVAKLREAFGPVTVLVNNAALIEFTPFAEISDEQWDRTMAINTRGPIICAQAVLPDMKAAKWGRIVNISSSGAQTGAPTAVPYTSSKAAIFGMTRSMALELGPLGITVNNIPPGAITGTPNWHNNLARFPIPEEQFLKSISVGRFGQPEDMGHAVAWLVSEGSGYINGQTIGVNGGRYLT
jgi:2-hydroxycyclohexanecarboxyl-CoA dehydrogenase